MAVSLRRRDLGYLARHGRGTRSHDDRRLGKTLGNRSGNAFLVVGAVGSERGHRSWHLIEQGANLGSVVELLRGQRGRDDLAGVSIQADVLLLPGPARLSVLAAVPGRVLTPHTATWLVLRRAEKRSTDDRALLADLHRHAIELNEAVALAEAFVGLVRDRALDRLDPWLQRAGVSGVQRLRGFAKRLSADYDAVRAAVSLSWSNGPVEGQINRLKTIKRQMYGRANLNLLGRRFLLAT